MIRPPRADSLIAIICVALSHNASAVKLLRAGDGGMTDILPCNMISIVLIKWKRLWHLLVSSLLVNDRVRKRKVEVNYQSLHCINNSQTLCEWLHIILPQWLSIHFEYITNKNTALVMQRKPPLGNNLSPLSSLQISYLFILYHFCGEVFNLWNYKDRLLFCYQGFCLWQCQ